MARVRVHNLSVSLDGYAAGPAQSPEAPLGVGGERLHAWIWDTRYGRAMIGESDGSMGVDDRWLVRGDEGIGATVMGRNMFGPVRGEWPDLAWTGWWGEEPPFHHPVFVLTHHPRPTLEMLGGTTFHFVTDGLEDALARASAAAAGGDVRLGGGVATVRAALGARLVDDLHLALVPVLLGAGERLFDGLGPWPDGYACAEIAASDAVAHLRFALTV